MASVSWLALTAVVAVSHASAPSTITASIAVRMVLLGLMFLVHLYAYHRLFMRRQHGLYAAAMAVAVLVCSLFTWYMAALLGRTPSAPSLTDVLREILAAAVFLGVAISLWFGVRQFRRQMRNQELEASLVRAELDALHAQLNPHFLFNSLNSIYSLVVSGDERAPGALLSFSNLLRYVSRTARMELVTLDEELQAVEMYTALQMLRFGPKVQYHLGLQHNAAWKIPPLTLLTLMENAFKHGVERSSAPCTVTLDIQATDAMLRWDVSNTVPPGAADQQNDGHADAPGLGLHTLVRRLELLYGTTCTTAISAQDGVFLVRSTIMA